MKNKYIGHPTQVAGVREMRMTGGKADGMRVLEVRNGKGLEFTVSLDRCADISYMFYKGNSMAYISPCGMVSPKFYDNKGAGFLKSFTAGFITTCGLTTFGAPSCDAGEELPLHGTISNTPSEQHSYSVDDDYIKINATVRDASIFGHQLILTREYLCSLKENTITVTDTVENIGSKDAPYMIMYHCNMGWPLLSENSILTISSNKVTPRDDHAAEDLERWAELKAPTPDFVEQCYYHHFDGEPNVSLKNPDINTELKISFDTSTLDCFTQWNMFGEGEYVLGLEPANGYPDGRDKMRKEGNLKFLKPGEKSINKVKFEFKDC